MNIDNIFKEEKIKYKISNIGYIKVYEFENESLLVVIKNNKNVFKISRKDFYKIDDLLLPYAFCLIDTSKCEMYYMKIKEPNNFLRNAFEHTNKDEIYFGKEILQNKINKEILIDNIKSIGEY